MSENTVITAEHVSGGYGTQPVWNDATFSIGKGEFITVLGPNGSGKTTLFRLLLGLLRPSAGALSVLGTSPSRGDARIGYVPQRHEIDRDTNIEAREFVKLGRIGTRWGIGRPEEGAREAEEALALVGAEKLAHTPLSRMSGGELQRIFLAQALVSDPKLLLLDEPLANLDIRREADLVNLIARIARERGVTVLLIAHNVNPLLPVTDRVLYIANRTIEIGTPDTVLTSAALSRLYGVPVEVLRDSHGRIAVIGIEESGLHNHEHDRSHD